MSGIDVFCAAEKLREDMRITAAIELYVTAEQNGYYPDRCAAARWTCHMLAGQWERAWRESDAIAQRGGPDPHRFWDGADWSGKDVLIRCLHGLGDTLQFIRYADSVRRTARSLTVEAQPKLKRLLQAANIADRVVTWTDETPPWQVQMEVNELPRIFRATPQTIPARVPYLNLVDAPRRIHDGKLRVGVIWAASDFDTSRNVPVDLLKPLLSIPGILFFSLQAGEGFAGGVPDGITPLCAEETCILQVAREMRKLDLILTVDTMNAHLAGGLGLKTWTMLPFQCDWRWMKDRSDTPWYPAMRLFRQPTRGDWQPVISDVKKELEKAASVVDLSVVDLIDTQYASVASIESELV